MPRRADGKGVGTEGGWEGRLGRAASRGPCELVSFRLFMGCTWDPVGAPATSPAQFSGGDFKAQLQLRREHPRGRAAGAR